MKRREVAALGLVALLLLVTAYLLSRGSAEVDAGPTATASTRPAKAPVVFPRDAPRKPEGALAQDRALPTGTTPAPLDAMQRVLLGDGTQTAIFVEANAIRHAPLMEKILQCRESDSAASLSELKRELGIDPSEDIDRIGFDGEVFVASGFFKDLKLPAEIGEGTPYGTSGRIWREAGADGEPVVFARLGDGMLLSAASEDKLKQAMDRAEGRSETVAPTTLPPGFGQSEVYGSVGADFIQGLITSSPDPQVQAIAQLVTESTVRMSVNEDAALSLDLKSPDDKSAKDLGSMVEAGLTLVRAKAVQEGDTELASLLEQARVARGADGRINLDLAVPGEVLLRAMGCAPDGTPLAPQLGPQAPARSRVESQGKSD